MDWNAFKVFLAIANTGSLSAAARRLSVNHSTVFRRLNALEKEMGGRLFDRFQQSYQLTDLGQEVLVLAKTIESAFDDIERHIAGKDFQPKGKVSITAPNNIAYHYLPGYLASFKQAYPDIEAEVLVGNHDFDLNRREADVAIRANAHPPENLVGKVIANIPWSVFCGVNYLDSKGGNKVSPRTMQEMKNHSVIGASEFLKKVAPFPLLDKSFAEQIFVRANDLNSMSYLAEAGHGLAILPNDQERQGLIKLFEVQPQVTSKLWLLTHPDLRNQTRIKLLIKHLTDCFEKEKRLI